MRDPLEVIKKMAADLRTLEVFGGRVVTASSEAELLQRLKALSLPAAGVLYGGLKPQAEAGKSLKMGISNKMAVVIAVVMPVPMGAIAPDTLPQDVAVLNKVRDTFLGKTSPTGHVWEFSLETPGWSTAQHTGWIQQWLVPIQIPPANGC